MTNYESGRLVARIFSHDVSRLLKGIVNATVAGGKTFSEFELGVIDEVSHWTSIDRNTESLLNNLRDLIAIGVLLERMDIEDRYKSHVREMDFTTSAQLVLAQWLEAWLKKKQ